MSGEERAVSRRTLLRAFGLTAATGALAASGALPGGAASAVRPVTVQQWAAVRGDRYHIAHRGSGDVLPEHSMPAYQAAVDWGASCLEISVGITSDGVLVCMHDATYERTTTGTGRLLDQPSSVLETIRIRQPQLGQAWIDHPPRVPLFEDVLRAFGGVVVLAVEAKVPEAYDPMMAAVQRHGLKESVIAKIHFTNTNALSRAKAAGYPVFCYFGAANETTADAIAATARSLNPATDYLVIPGYSYGGGPYLSDDIVAGAVGTGIPVWVHPLHRRIDAQHFFDKGTAGAICSSYGYLARACAPVSTDSWAGQAISSGEMSRDPSSDTYAPTLTRDGTIVLGVQAKQHFITLGQCGSIATSSPTAIDLDVSWATLPADDSDCLEVAFGRVDDSYYEHRQGNGDGYHAILRRNGSLGVYRHRDGQKDGEALTAESSTPALRPGQWAHLRIETSNNGLRVSRTDSGTTVTASSVAVDDGYLHIGRASLDGVAAFRALRVS